MAYVVTVEFKVAAGAMDQFLIHMRDNAAASVRTEPGCRQFDLCTDPARPDHVFLYKVYDDAAAFAAHPDTSHFATFCAVADHPIAAKSVRTYESVIAHHG